MKTDDFLADLGQQLRVARPHRDRRPILALAVVAALAVAILAFVVARPEPRERPSVRPPVPPAASPRVVILNASGYDGYQRRVAMRLRASGFTVTHTEPRFGRPSFRTRLEAIGGDARPARRVAGALGLPATVEVTPVFGTSEPSDVAVYVGADVAGADALKRRLQASSCRADARPWFFTCSLPAGRYSVSLRRNGCYAAKPLFTNPRELSGCGARP